MGDEIENTKKIGKGIIYNLTLKKFIYYSHCKYNLIDWWRCNLLKSIVEIFVYLTWILGMFFLILLLLLLQSCNKCPIIFPYADQTSYEINKELQTTPNGIKVDASGIPIDLKIIDKIFDETEKCLRENFPKQKFDDEYRFKVGCALRGFELPIKRDCIKVKIADDCTLNHDGTQELLNSFAPETACDGKYIDAGPSEEWPCKWRAGIQDYNVIVTCPSLYLIKDPLVRLVTGCVRIWDDPKMANCAKPSTKSLSGFVIK